jgi:hypothetical protein
LKNDLIKAYDAKGMRASGKFADELVVESGIDSVKLIGEKYAEQLQYGRRAGKRPPIEAIKQWIKDKGIVSNIKNDANNSSLAFLIARKIGQQGWNRQGYGGVNLIDEVITTNRIQDIINKVGAELTLTFVSTLQREFENIKV